MTSPQLEGYVYNMVQLIWSIFCLIFHTLHFKK